VFVEFFCFGVVFVVNENDVMVMDEIMFGDNDVFVV